LFRKTFTPEARTAPIARFLTPGAVEGGVVVLPEGSDTLGVVEDGVVVLPEGSDTLGVVEDGVVVPPEGSESPGEVGGLPQQPNNINKKERTQKSLRMPDSRVSCDVFMAAPFVPAETFWAAGVS
jgi:hypothetical protein